MTLNHLSILWTTCVFFFNSFHIKANLIFLNFQRSLVGSLSIFHHSFTLLSEIQRNDRLSEFTLQEPLTILYSFSHTSCFWRWGTPIKLCIPYIFRDQAPVVQTMFELKGSRLKILRTKCRLPVASCWFSFTEGTILTTAASNILLTCSSY